MSQYRLAFQNDVLVRQKRKFLFFWRWAFNRSEEDALNKLKNQIVNFNDQLNRARRLLPKKEADIAAKKKALLQWMQQSSAKAGPVWRDSWSPRRRPLPEPPGVRSAKKKGLRSDRGPLPPTELARLVIAPDANKKRQRSRRS